MKFIRKIIPILVFFISCSLQTHATETSNIIYQRFLNNLKVDSSKFKIELNNNNLDSLTGDKFTIKIRKSEQTIENFYCDTNKIYFLDKKEPVNYIAVNNVFYIPYFSLFQNKIEKSITKELKKIFEIEDEKRNFFISLEEIIVANILFIIWLIISKEDIKFSKININNIKSFTIFL